MPSKSDKSAKPGLSAAPSDQEALLLAVRSVLAPLAELAVTKGLPYATVEEALRRAFVESAQAAQVAQGLPPNRLVSRIATATGINRREVTRITQLPPDEGLSAGASLASQVFTRWVSDKAWRHRGKPRVLPRQGDDSFETLARSVTQDVHPRTLLDELVRLQLARWDEATDTINLLEEAFTPHGDLQDMLGFLGSNVGDHLQAAVGNVLSSRSLHFEQAVFAQGLPESAAEAVRALARRHWTALMAEAVPLLEASLRDAAAAQTPGEPAPATHRVRLGLFTFHDPGDASNPAKPVRQGGAVRRRSPDRS
jgi:hypothetical protein